MNVVKTLNRAQNIEVKVRLVRNLVYCPHTHTHTHMMNCSTWTTETVGVIKPYVWVGQAIVYALFGRPFVRRFALCYRTVVLSVFLSVCNVGALWPNGWTDQDETWHAGRHRPWPYCVRWGPSFPSPKGAQPPNFWPISVVAKWLDVSRCHLIAASAKAILC